MKQVHGGDIYSYQNVLDFSANINPLGTPDAVLSAIENSMHNICHYPDPLNRDLCSAIAAYENLLPEQVLCGNGAADLLYTLCYAMKPRKALLAVPAFLEYEQALHACGCEIEYFFMDETNNYSLPEVFLEHITTELDMIILCNPNNPTGSVLTREQLFPILEKCNKNNVYLLVDECFLDFLSDKDTYTMKPYLDSGFTIILKAFTKIYAMPGLRLGYCLCNNKNLFMKMKKSAQPWSVSVPASAAGIAALNEKEFLAQSIRYISQEREILEKVLIKSGFRVFHPHANYIFFQDTIWPQSVLFELMLEHSILIRCCGNYKGLDSTFYRIAVRTKEENQIFMNTLNSLLERRS